MTRTRPRSWAAGLAIVLFVALATPVIAYAHARLKSSSPASGAHLNAAPRAIRLDFSEVPELTFSSMQLLDPAGQPVALGPLQYPADSKRAFVATIVGGLPAGDYTVNWQVAGDDGHPVRDRFKFVIAAGASGVSAAGAVPGGTAGLDSNAARAAAMNATQHHDPSSMPEGNGFGSDSFVYVLIRWGMFVGLLVAIGAVAFRQLVLRFLRSKEEPDSPMLDDAARRAANCGHWAAGALALILVLRLLAQSAAMHGQGGVFDGGLIAAMVQKTMWGHGWLLQLVGIVVTGAGFHMARNAVPLSGQANRGWGIATIGVMILAFTPGLAGHAAAAPRMKALTLLADGLHVMGAGGWLGSLTMVLLAGIPAALALPEADRGPMIAELVNAFSPTALMFAGLVGTTGLFAAWIHLGSVPAIWQTRYGQLLIIKLTILSVVAVTGAYNWLRVKPTLGHVEGGVRIRRSATVEVVIGVLVLLVTAILVATPTAMDMQM
jgi:putative copper export protein/methionine-rich copper-binding protein CopC